MTTNRTPCQVHIELFADPALDPTDPDITDESHATAVAQAKNMCARCPALDACRDWVNTCTLPVYGVVAGLGPGERHHSDDDVAAFTGRQTSSQSVRKAHLRAGREDQERAEAAHLLRAGANVYPPDGLPVHADAQHGELVYIAASPPEPDMVAVANRTHCLPALIARPPVAPPASWSPGRWPRTPTMPALAAAIIDAMSDGASHNSDSLSTLLQDTPGLDDIYSQRCWAMSVSVTSPQENIRMVRPASLAVEHRERIRRGLKQRIRYSLLRLHRNNGVVVRADGDRWQLHDESVTLWHQINEAHQLAS